MAGIMLEPRKAVTALRDALELVGRAQEMVEKLAGLEEKLRNISRTEFRADLD